MLLGEAAQIPGKDLGRLSQLIGCALLIRHIANHLTGACLRKDGDKLL